ncbi:MAG: type II toxin-antitoxin system RelE/ParE family toxin [Spirochaetes bacterium]|nr:type II toxin-antitoxin system RelE/ParE family toxin [Spirochaetota bacterium]
MKVEFLEQFLKDIRKIKDPILKEKVAGIIIDFENSHSLSGTSDIKKLKGWKNAYRIRLGDYRIGFFHEKGTVVFARIVHRKDIYRIFP